MKDSDATLTVPTWDDALAAHQRILPHIHRTPVLTSSFLDRLTGARLFFKCENFQKAGAFKVRGASNAVFGLSDAEAARGVATHSSGNHALSLSYAAGRRGIPCHVVMPRTAPQAKKDAVRAYGGVITECEPSTSSREEVFARCTACHSTAIIRRSGLQPAAWDELMDWMTEKHGMPPREGADRALVVDYLARSFPPRRAPRGGANPFLN